MAKLCAVFFSLTILAITSSAFISDEVKEFRFAKTKDGSDEYDFEYELDNGETFHGQTFYLHNNRVLLYMMFGAEDSIYWVRLSSQEFLHKKNLPKMVRLAQRSDDKITMQDDEIIFEFTISTGDLKMASYATKWNLEKICFTKSEKKDKTTFDYVIAADNNSRTLNDTTMYEKDDPRIQRVAVVDYPHCDGVYEVKFTDDELQSNQTFCKGISSVLSQHASFGAITVKDVNPSLSKFLAHKEE